METGPLTHPGRLRKKVHMEGTSRSGPDPQERLLLAFMGSPLGGILYPSVFRLTYLRSILGKTMYIQLVTHSSAEEWGDG